MTDEELVKKKSFLNCFCDFMADSEGLSMEDMKKEALSLESDERLMSLLLNRIGVHEFEEANEFRAELLSRLAKGQRAIEAMEKMVKADKKAFPWASWFEDEVIKIIREWEGEK